MQAKTLLLVTTTAALSASCGDSTSNAGPFPASAPSVLLVTLDTTRADRLGCYGYEPAQTPNLDGLAAGGVRFERAYSHVPLTLPSHATLLSGVHPVGTGLHVNFQGAVNAEVPLLAEMFAASGYRTGAFIAAWVLNSEFGLARGFQTYDDLTENSQDKGVQVERDASEITEAALAWLEREPAARFFAWVHYFDAHDPYEPPAEFADAATPYDGEIAYMDGQLGRILAWLEDHGRREQTLVIVTGDHGEGLGEHGEATHGLFIYDSTLHVPLIVSWPGTLGARTLSSAVGLVDVHPTIVELCGATSSTLVEGHSLSAALAGGPLAATPVYAESEYSLRSFGWAPLSSIRTGSWKYIEAPRVELFATDEDPAELNELSAQQSRTLEQLRGALRQLRSGWTAREAAGVELVAGAGSNLAALGYVDGAVDISGVELEDLRDPKDALVVFSGTMRAKTLHDSEQYAEVVELLTPLVAASPESDEVWSLLGASLLKLERFEEARGAIANSLRVRPDLPGRLAQLGEAHLGLKDMPAALEAFGRAAEHDAENPQVQSRLGLVYAQLKDFARSEVHYRRQAELEPESANAHTNLANILFAQSRFDEGLKQVDAALELDAKCKPAWIARLQALLATSRVVELRETMRRCLAATPGDEAFHQNLLGFARSTGDTELIEIAAQ